VIHPSAVRAFQGRDSSVPAGRGPEGFAVSPARRARVNVIIRPVLVDERFAASHRTGRASGAIPVVHPDRVARAGPSTQKPQKDSAEASCDDEVFGSAPVSRGATSARPVPRPGSMGGCTLRRHAHAVNEQQRHTPTPKRGEPSRRDIIKADGNRGKRSRVRALLLGIVDRGYALRRGLERRSGRSGRASPPSCFLKKASNNRREAGHPSPRTREVGPATSSVRGEAPDDRPWPTSGLGRPAWVQGRCGFRLSPCSTPLLREDLVFAPRPPGRGEATRAVVIRPASAPLDPARAGPTMIGGNAQRRPRRPRTCNALWADVSPAAVPLERRTLSPAPGAEFRSRKQGGQPSHEHVGGSATRRAWSSPNPPMIWSYRNRGKGPTERRSGPRSPHQDGLALPKSAMTLNRETPGPR